MRKQSLVICMHWKSWLKYKTEGLTIWPVLRATTHQNNQHLPPQCFEAFTSNTVKKSQCGEFPTGPVVRTLLFHCQGGRFNTWLLKVNWLACCCSVAQSCQTLCDPTDYRMPGSPVCHPLPELAQTHVHRVGDAIQPSHPLSSPTSPAFNLFQHQGLFQWDGSLHQVAKVLELSLQHQSFQWIFRVDLINSIS